MLPCFRRGLALRKGAATSLSGWSSACIRIRPPGLPAPGNTIPGVLRDPIAAGLRHLRAGSPLVSRCVRRCCTRMLRGHSPVPRCAGRPAGAPRSARSCPAVLVELQQYLVALQSPYEEVRCIPVYREPAPSCVAVGECRFERIVGTYGPQAERRAGFHALFGPAAQIEAPVGKLDLGRRVRIVPRPLGSEPVGREVICEIEYGLLCHAGKRHRLRQGCCFPAPEMKPQVIAQDDLLQHRLASQKEILTGQIGVAEVEHPPVGRIGFPA